MSQLTSHEQDRGALLIALAEHVVRLPAQGYASSTHAALCAALRRVATRSEPKPNAYGHQEHCNYPGSPCVCKEPKVSEEAYSAGQQAYWGGKGTTSDNVRAAIKAAAPFICAAKDHDTATVIADNNAKMAEIERLKRTNELYHGDIAVLRERHDALVAKQSELRDEIRLLKQSLEMYRCLKQ